jgi:hypothetical protein
MNGFIKRTMALACLGTSLAALAGCKLWDNFVDPCYPGRYSWAARQPIYESFGAQASNGHVLDQTVWNFYFEKDKDGVGTDRLTPYGKSHLRYLIQRRPEPDTKIWLATAYDVRPYDSENPQRYAADRELLNAKRIQALHNYLQAETAGHPVAFEIGVHNPPEPSLAGSIFYRPPGAGVVPQVYSNFTGIMPTQGTGPGMTTGGPTGPSPR